MTEQQKRIAAFFYATPGGVEPVREWLKSLDRENCRIIGHDIRTVEFGWPLGMPLCRPISSRKGLWEVRTNLPNKRIARVLFCTNNGRMVLLHGFIKKTQKTPDSDLDLAAKRIKEVVK